MICYHANELYLQHSLHALVRIEADSRQRDDLDVANGQTHEETLEPAFPEDQARRFGDAQPVAVADGPRDLHPAANHLERVRDGLRDGARDAARCELGPGAQGCGLVGGCARGLRERSVFPEQRGPEDVADGIVCQE